SSSPPRPPLSTPYPYTTLFRSERLAAADVRETPTRRPRTIGQATPAGRLPPTRSLRLAAPDLRLWWGVPGARPPLSSSAWHTRSDRKSTRLNSSHVKSSYAVFC